MSLKLFSICFYYWPHFIFIFFHLILLVFFLLVSNLPLFWHYRYISTSRNINIFWHKLIYSLIITHIFMIIIIIWFIWRIYWIVFIIYPGLTHSLINNHNITLTLIIILLFIIFITTWSIWVFISFSFLYSIFAFILSLN